MKKHKDKFMTKVKKNVAATKTIIAGSMVGGVICLLIGTQFAPDKNFIPTSQLATTQQFSNTSGGTIEIINQEMDWARHIMKIDIQASDELVMKNLETSVFIKRDTGSSVQVIPTVDNKATIFVKNLNNDFQVLSLAIEDKEVRSDEVDIKIYDDKRSEASSHEEDAASTEDERTVYFYISENSKYLKSASNKIQVKSQKDYAIDVLNDEIHFQNSQFEKLERGISKLNDLQTKNKSEIENLKKENKYLTGAQLDNNQKQIINLQTDIQNAQNQSEEAEKNKIEVHKKIDKMQKQISDIQSDNYHFPADEKTQKLKG